MTALVGDVWTQEQDLGQIGLKQTDRQSISEGKLIKKREQADQKNQKQAGTQEPRLDSLQVQRHNRQLLFKSRFIYCIYTKWLVRGNEAQVCWQVRIRWLGNDRSWLRATGGQAGNDRTGLNWIMAGKIKKSMIKLSLWHPEEHLVFSLIHNYYFISLTWPFLKIVRHFSSLILEFTGFSSQWVHFTADTYLPYRSISTLCLCYFHLKDHCAGFRVYWQKWNIIFININY